MFCRRARNWISLALDGALPPDRTVALTRHLESCAACREYERDLQTGRRLLAASAPQLSEGFEWRLQLRLSRTLQEAAREVTTPWEVGRTAPGAWLRGAVFAAAGGLAVVAAVALFVLPAERGPSAWPGGVPSRVVMVHPSPAAPAVATAAAPAGEPATVISTAGDPTRTSTLGSLAAPLRARDGSGQAVDLRLPGASTERRMFEREGWSGASLEDLRSIASLREQNRRLRDQLAQAQREVVLLRAQTDTSRGSRAAPR